MVQYAIARMRYHAAGGGPSGENRQTTFAAEVTHKSAGLLRARGLFTERTVAPLVNQSQSASGARWSWPHVTM